MGFSALSGHLYNTSFPLGSSIIAEEGTRNLSEPDLDIFTKAFFGGYDSARTVAHMNSQ